MSATLNGFGLKPKWNKSGYVRPNAYPVGILSGYTSAIYKYSPVLMQTSGLLAIATVANDFLGVFAGVEYVDSTGRQILSPYWPASATYASDMVAYIWDDPTIVFDIQCDGSLAQTALGDEADFTTATIGSGNMTTGYSSATLSSTLKGAGVQGQLQVVGLVPSVDNAWGDAFTNVQVRIARHQYVSNKVAI